MVLVLRSLIIGNILKQMLKSPKKISIEKHHNLFFNLIIDMILSQKVLSKEKIGPMKMEVDLIKLIIGIT
jgi:hypothetical protein